MFRLIGKAVKLVLGGLVLLILLALVLPKGNKGAAPTSPQPSTVQSAPAQVEAQPEPKSKTLHEGDEVTISLPSANFVFFAVTDDGWDAMLDAQNRQDKEELLALVDKGKVFAERSGVQAKLIERRFASCKVRIRDGIHPGAEGWIQREEVHPYEPTAEPAPEPVATEKTPVSPTKSGRTFTTDERADSAFTIGRNLELSSKTDAAVKQYRQVIKEYPGTDAATRSEKRIKALSAKP